KHAWRRRWGWLTELPLRERCALLLLPPSLCTIAHEPPTAVAYRYSIPGLACRNTVHYISTQGSVSRTDWRCLPFWAKGLSLSGSARCLLAGLTAPPSGPATSSSRLPHSIEAAEKVAKPSELSDNRARLMGHRTVPEKHALCLKSMAYISNLNRKNGYILEGKTTTAMLVDLDSAGPHQESPFVSR
ncbi:hypothetical protein LX36DRAFT_652303, partial [Colletotrichum falcatum]